MTALDEWYGKHENGDDYPTIYVQRPSSLPNAHITTLNQGCRLPALLPQGPLMMTVTVGGVRFYSDAEDLKLLFEAVLEVINNAIENVSQLKRKDE